VNVWVAALAVIAAVNAPRRRAAVPQPIAPAVAVTGAAVSWLAIVVAAAVSGPLLDALAVSAPNIQIAAGLVLLVRAIVDAATPPGHEPARLDGRWQALVPVAFPLLIRPEVALLALAAGAELGVARAVAIAAPAYLAAAVALAVWRGERAARTVGVALSVMGVAAAVDLVIDGVLAV